LQYLPIAIALLLEFLGPVLVIGWVWLVRRQPPGPRTVLGAGIALVGLALLEVAVSAVASWVLLGQVLTPVQALGRRADPHRGGADEHRPPGRSWLAPPPPPAPRRRLGPRRCCGGFRPVGPPPRHRFVGVHQPDRDPRPAG